VGVADTITGTGVQVATAGTHTVNFDGSYSPAVNWFACTSASTAGQVTPQATACDAGRQVGMVTVSGSGITSGTIDIRRTASVTGGGGGITTLNTLTATTQTFATPGTTGTAPNWSSVTDTHTLNIPMASTASVTAGLISKTDYDTFNGKPSLVASGTAGVGPSKAGTVATAARSDHDHRSIHAMTWFFPGTPSTGVQNMTLPLPEGIVNPAITDMRVTVNTTSASSSTFNIQRCTGTCTGASPTFADIYSTALTLNASTRTAAKGSAPNQNVSGLAAGDQFKANLVTIGSGLADVTVTMTVKYDTTN